LDIYNLKGDYEGLEKAADRLLGVSSLAQSKVGNQIKSIKQQSAFKRAESLEKFKDYTGSAKAYESFADLNPASPLVAAALFNAAVNYERASAPGSALGLYGKVLSNPKANKDLKKKSKKFRAILLEETGQYLQAAKEFEGYAKAFPKDPYSIDAHYNAAVIYQGFNRYNSATANYKAYYSASKKKDRLEVPIILAGIAEKRRRWSNAIKLYEDYFNSTTPNAEGVVKAAFKIATLSERLGQKAKAKRWYQKTVVTQRGLAKKGKTVGVRYAAEAQFKLVYKTYEDLRKVKITLKDQNRSVQKKLNLINQLAKELKTVVVYDDPEYIVAPLTLQGMAFQHMAVAIQSVPAPKELKGDDLKTYQAGVDNVVKDFENKAFENYKTAIAKAHELQSYSKWLRAALTEISSLNPGYLRDYGFIVFESRETQFSKKSPRVDQENDNKRVIEDKEYESLESAVRAGFHNEVLDKVGKILASRPGDARALNALAVHHYKRKEYGLAEIILERALEKNQEDPALHHNLGVIHLTRDENRLARVQFRRAIGINDLYVPSLSYLGAEALSFRDFNRALTPLKVSYNGVKSNLRLGKEEAVGVGSNFALALIGLGEEDKGSKIFAEIMDTETKNTSVMLNYAILQVEVLKVKEKPIELLSRIKFLSEDPKVIKRVGELEERLQESQK
jgi:tetratricopeptide (TPR) repeat protein